MTLKEYEWQMKAYGLKQLDKEEVIHKQAFLNHVVQATKERGKNQVPVYPTFESFFNKKLLERELTEQEEEDDHDKMKQLVLIANSKGGEYE